MTASKRVANPVLDPVDRAGEILFGLIMVLTFTNSLSVADAGRADVRAMLIAALGCNLAWGIIDAAMYLLTTRAARVLEVHELEAVKSADDPVIGREAVADMVSRFIRPVLTDDDLERLRLHLVGLPRRSARLGASDYRAAFGVFLLVFTCTFPVVVPFLVFREAEIALPVSNLVAIVSLFLAGYTLGGEVGHPLRAGAATVTAGVVLVGVAKALGG